MSTLEKAEFRFRIEPFIDNATWKVLYQRGHYFQKVFGFIKGFLKRWWTLLFRVPFYDFIFIHRESSPIGPPVFEWIIAKVFDRKIIYDFDDAIWIPNTSAQNKFANWLKASWKIKYICKWAYKITPGNDYLCQYAKQFNNSVVKIPTCIDVENYREKAKTHYNGNLVVGWTGSHSTLRYLDPLVPVIEDLQKENDFTFLVIADKNPGLPLQRFEFVPWSAANEINDLLKLDIGVMPLTEDQWSEGKCGFKLIQYFSCGIPAIASPVGVNKIIVEDGVSGYLSFTQDDWKRSLQKLLKDADLRKKMGEAGRSKIFSVFSIQSQTKKFIEVFS